jgi:DNA-binding transcriptional LysR family regulator
MLIDHLEKLRHFVGVVRANSIRGYAIQHNLSQPAISKSIQILEATLESGILVRDRNGVQLTQSGKRLYEWAEKLVEECAQVESDVRQSGNVRLNGKLTLGTYQSIAVYFLPQLYLFLNRTQKNLRLRFVTSASAELVQKLKSGEVDFIISIDPPEERGVFRTVLFKDTFSLYRSTKSERKVGSSPIFSLGSAKDGKGRTVEQFIRAAKMSEFLVSCGDFEAAKAMLDADAGLAFLPERVAKPLVNFKRAEKVANADGLSGVGEHSVVFAAKAHRADDLSIKWIAEQIRVMLKDDRNFGS